MANIQKITPFLWYNGQAEDAAKLYTSLFENSKITAVVPYGDHGPGKKGDTMMVTFVLDGMEFQALNGGPQFPFTEAVSFMVSCDTQDEIDRFWNGLTANGGREVECGWLKDPFGLSWQIVPSAFGELMSKATSEQANRMMGVVLSSKKLEIAKIMAAYEGK